MAVRDPFFPRHFEKSVKRRSARGKKLNSIMLISWEPECYLFLFVLDVELICLIFFLTFWFAKIDCNIWNFIFASWILWYFFLFFIENGLERSYQLDLGNLYFRLFCKMNFYVTPRLFLRILLSRAKIIGEKKWEAWERQVKTIVLCYSSQHAIS